MKWFTIVSLLIGLAISVPVSRASDQALTAFATQKRNQMEYIATHNHLVVSPEQREFFRAAEAGEWDAVTNAFERIRPSPWPPLPEANAPILNLEEVLFVPIHETWGAYVEFNDWDRDLLQRFADGVLRSIPDGSIYFGGTGSGRFIITAIRDIAKTPDIFILTPKFTYVGYLDYLRMSYGDRISIPSQQDMSLAFQKYVEDVRAGRIPAGTEVTFENGQIRVADAQGVMMINGILTRMIFDANKTNHDFYVEESYVIPWMYPYLTPHGLIMKLNSEPVTLTPEIVKTDNDFWNSELKTLLGDHAFLANSSARMTFSKLRSAIGGLYAARRNLAEAEQALQQAITLCPTSAEANFRLTDVYLQQFKFDDATGAIEKFLGRDPSNKKVAEYLTQIRHLGQIDVRRRELEQLVANSVATTNAPELIDIYRQMGMQQQLDELNEKLANQTNKPPRD